MAHVEVTTARFSTTAGSRTALVVTPRVHVRVDASRLAELRAGGPPSPIDTMVLERGRALRGSAHVCVFRGVSSDDVGSWAFAPELSSDEARELGELLLGAQMNVYRGLLRAELYLFVHVEFGPVEVDAFRMAAASRIAECGALLARPESSGRSRALVEADLWILRNVVYFFELRYEAMIERILPEKLALLEKRMHRVRDMVLASPE